MRKGTPGRTYAADEVMRENVYRRQNKVLHAGRAQLGMSVDDLRDLAGDMFGITSISSLTIEQRGDLIDQLKAKGARIYNVKMRALYSRQKQFASPDRQKDQACPDGKKRFKSYFLERLEHWDKRFTRERPDFATNRQLALIESLWKAYFDDSRPGSGLRGFLVRQTQGLENGPVSALEFLRDEHVGALLGPLKARVKATGIEEFFDENKTETQ